MNPIFVCHFFCQSSQSLLLSPWFLQTILSAEHHGCMHHRYACNPPPPPHKKYMKQKNCRILQISEKCKTWRKPLHFISSGGHYFMAVFWKYSAFQNPSPPSERAVFFGPRSSEQKCSETNSKSIFRSLWILVFEIWSFKIHRIVWKKNVIPNRCAMFWNWFFWFMSFF